jgi:hypothetical protein
MKGMVILKGSRIALSTNGSRRRTLRALSMLTKPKKIKELRVEIIRIFRWEISISRNGAQHLRLKNLTLNGLGFTFKIITFRN